MIHFSDQKNINVRVFEQKQRILWDFHDDV